MLLKLLGGTAGGFATYIIGNYIIEKSTCKPLHIEVTKQPSIPVFGVNILPAIGAFFRALPESTRRKLINTQNAPKSVNLEDWFDVFGKDPYAIEEIVPGKVWSVQFKFVNNSLFDPDAEKGMKILGLDYSSEEGKNRILEAAELWRGQPGVEQAKKDIAEVSRIKALIAEKGKCPETIAELPNIVYMAVVKLNNGDVLLYSPVKVRDETGFSEWLKNIGQVKWVVVGSSSHTLQLPGVITKFPDANYVVPMNAWDKLKNLKELNLKTYPEYDYTNPEELANLNTLLANEGVSMHHVNGDTITETLVVNAHGTALECDLVYSRPNGILMNEKDENSFGRLFNLALCKKPSSPNNALPPYRFWFMDPTCDLSVMQSLRPKKDGSTCTDMADSLRTVLKEDFDHAIGVHTGPIPGNDFKESLNHNWSWLDGKSLLHPKN